MQNIGTKSNLQSRSAMTVKDRFSRSRADSQRKTRNAPPEDSLELFDVVALNWLLIASAVSMVAFYGWYGVEWYQNGIEFMRAKFPGRGFDASVLLSAIYTTFVLTALFALNRRENKKVVAGVIIWSYFF